MPAAFRQKLLRVVSKTLEQPTWRNTTIIRENVIESVRAVKAQPGWLAFTMPPGEPRMTEADAREGLP